MLKGGKSTAYRNGVVSIYRDKGAKSDFSALKAPKSLDDMDLVVKLAFKENSKRTQDVELSEQQGFTLSYKIQTRYVPSVEAKHKAVIGGKLYDIGYIDKTNREMFLYLTFVRNIEGGSNA